MTRVAAVGTCIAADARTASPSCVSTTRTSNWPCNAPIKTKRSPFDRLHTSSFPTRTTTLHAIWPALLRHSPGFVASLSHCSSSPPTTRLLIATHVRTNPSLSNLAPRRSTIPAVQPNPSFSFRVGCCPRSDSIPTDDGISTDHDMLAVSWRPSTPERPGTTSWSRLTVSLPPSAILASLTTRSVTSMHCRSTDKPFLLVPPCTMSGLSTAFSQLGAPTKFPTDNRCRILVRRSRSHRSWLACG